MLKLQWFSHPRCHFLRLVSAVEELEEGCGFALILKHERWLCSAWEEGQRAREKRRLKTTLVFLRPCPVAGLMKKPSLKSNIHGCWRSLDWTCGGCPHYHPQLGPVFSQKGSSGNVSLPSMVFGSHCREVLEHTLDTFWMKVNWHALGVHLIES